MCLYGSAPRCFVSSLPSPGWVFWSHCISQSAQMTDFDKLCLSRWAEPRRGSQWVFRLHVLLEAGFVCNSLRQDRQSIPTGGRHPFSNSEKLFSFKQSFSAELFKWRKNGQALSNKHSPSLPRKRAEQYNLFTIYALTFLATYMSWRCLLSTEQVLSSVSSVTKIACHLHNHCHPSDYLITPRAKVVLLNA